MNNYVDNRDATLVAKQLAFQMRNIQQKEEDNLHKRIETFKSDTIKIFEIAVKTKEFATKLFKDKRVPITIGSMKTYKLEEKDYVNRLYYDLNIPFIKPILKYKLVL